MSFFIKILSLIVLTSSLGACGLFEIYRMDIDQGNLVDKQDLKKVHLGMTKADVKHILGEPLLQDFFHADRWDYITLLRPAKKPLHREHVSFEFKNNILVKIN
jgi:outer membrane protein assembly factor BamE